MRTVDFADGIPSNNLKTIRSFVNLLPVHHIVIMTNSKTWKLRLKYTCKGKL